MIKAYRQYRTTIDLPALSGDLIPCGSLVKAIQQPLQNGVKMNAWDCEVVEYTRECGSPYVVRTQERHLRREPWRP